ncbi:hypothetical protein V5O48_010890 [Marasmius crinis-equi]|uniref:Uncharacterized protein n=1 Tax=Marasmius crinis-equi TaxID=585013 RepID=A0ABR3F746_9AGAR
MVGPVKAGDEVSVPMFSAEVAEALVKVKSKEDMAEREAGYYAVEAKNITTGKSFPMFIGAERYENTTDPNPSHITKIGELKNGGKCNCSFRDIHHSKTSILRRGVQIKDRRPIPVRTPSQGCFIAASKAMLAKIFGTDELDKWIKDIEKSDVGVALRTFSVLKQSTSSISPDS